MVSDKVIDIATSTREWAEETNRELDHPYHCDLMGMCAVASIELTNRLRRAKLHNKHNISIGYNDEHCFVLVDDHVVDVTATQFHKTRDKKVYIEKWELINHRSEYMKRMLFTTTKQLKQHLRKQKWPLYQISTKYVNTEKNA